MCNDMCYKLRSNFVFEKEAPEAPKSLKARFKYFMTEDSRTEGICNAYKFVKDRVNGIPKNRTMLWELQTVEKRIRETKQGKKVSNQVFDVLPKSIEAKMVAFNTRMNDGIPCSDPKDYLKEAEMWLGAPEFIMLNMILLRLNIHAAECEGTHISSIKNNTERYQNKLDFFTQKYISIWGEY